MNKLMCSLLFICSSTVFANAPDFDEYVESFEKNLTNVSQKLAGKNGNAGFFVLTKNNKLVRLHVNSYGTRGIEMNEKITKHLLKYGHYENNNEEVLPELNLKCKYVAFKLYRDKQLGIGYSEGCEPLS